MNNLNYSARTDVHLKIINNRKRNSKPTKEKPLIKIEEDTQTLPAKNWTAGMPKNRNGEIALPNCALRSAMFPAIQNKQKTLLANEKIEATGNTYIIFSGEQLSQSDIEVWGECVRRAMLVNFETVEFKIGDFLKKINRNQGGNDRLWLINTIERLINVTIEIIDCKRKYTGHLISERLEYFESENIKLNINPNLSSLFLDGNWTYVKLDKREKLREKPLALWLYCFYCSHNGTPFPMKVETIQKLCGSDAKYLKSFKQKLKKALILISCITDWQCEIDENNLINVKK